MVEFQRNQFLMLGSKRLNVIKKERTTMKSIGNKRFAFYVLHFAFAAATGVVYGNAPASAPAATIDSARA